MGKYEGSSRVALKPQTTDQVSQILRHCNANHIAVVPQVSHFDWYVSHTHVCMSTHCIYESCFRADSPFCIVF